ncbi:hypothetical protein [Alkaliphilus transvaalensis]|uniref:hypothetical protein n=1 Tax=Alkaliphilus transvaalensis TaxID=114628 RepID=UPI0005527E09|nr:hypothetical protein [Alkaliphilus transvaalensis]
MYFKLFSIIWGALMIGITLIMHIIPKQWNDFELNKIYTEERPKWVLAAGAIAILIVATTWYKEMTTDISFSIFLTLLVTITLIKIAHIMFNYVNFINFVIKALVEDRSIINKINVTTTVLGLFLILFGFFIY